MITPEKLKEIRIQNKLSQDDLAQITGVHYQYISDLERGVKPISHKFSEKLKQKGLIKDEGKKEAIREKWFDRLTESELQTLEKITKEDKAALILFFNAINGDIAKIELLSQYLKSRYTVNISE
jgi:transcriptional regulator with XRE-family HTH domain